MSTTKLQTQVRAEIGWFWQQSETDDQITQSGAIRYRQNVNDRLSSRMEGVWKQTGQTIRQNSVSVVELDYLTRSVLDADADIGFMDIRSLVISNKSSSCTLEISPNSISGWQGPWGQADGKFIVPPGGVLLISAGSVPWNVPALENKLAIKALDADGFYDIAIVGKIGDLPSVSSSGSTSSSSNSTSSGTPDSSPSSIPSSIPDSSPSSISSSTGASSGTGV